MESSKNNAPETKGQPGTANTVRLPSLINQIKSNSSSVLRNQLIEMFGTLDDVLFDLAQNAKNNNEQNLLFESLRELRVKKESFINQFFNEYTTLYQNLVHDKQPRRSVEDSETKPDSIGLMDHDELEKKVAVTNMVTYARNNFQEDLYFLNCRFDSLLPYCKVDEQNNPLAPSQICHAFLESSKVLDFETEKLLIVLKYFDKTVIKHLDKIYSAANQLLKDSGVLPKIATPVPKRDSAQTDQNLQAALEDQLALMNAEPQTGLTFNGLSTMLQALRQRGATLPFANMITTPTTGITLPQAELISLLSNIQHPAAGAFAGISADSSLDIRSAVQAILEANKKDSQPVKLTQSDEDVINLISWLFDIILEDDNVDAEIRALISRLQIPILRLALRDKTFFSHTKHPAHRLINEIARTSIGWSKSDQAAQDALYAIIKDVVSGIIESGEDSHTVFTESLEKINRFQEKEEKNTAKIEQRISEQEKAKAKQGKIRDLCRQILLDRLQDKVLPQEITDFIFQSWQEILVLSHLKYGKDSNEWLSALQCLDDLIWSTQPHEDSKSKERFQKILPKLQADIKEKLALISSNESEAEAIFKRLERIHTFIAKDQLEEIDYQPLQSEQLEALRKTEDLENKPWKEMSAVERQQVQYKSLMFDYIKKAEEMPIGTWVIVETPDQGISQRCKLAARIDDNDTFIFVNRFGFKVMQKKRKDFAYEMQCKRIKPVETGLLFDRALGKISNNLKKLTSEPEAAG